MLITNPMALLKEWGCNWPNHLHWPVFNYIQFKLICIALFTIQITAKQLYRKCKCNAVDKYGKKEAGTGEHLNILITK